MKKLFRQPRETLVESLRSSHEVKDFDDLVRYLRTLYPSFNITNPVISYYGSDNRTGGWFETYVVRNQKDGWVLGHMNCDIRMTETIEDLEAKIAELKKQVEVKKKTDADALKELEKAEFERLNPTRRLAIMLHHCTCRQNHIDGCTWHYETSWKDFDPKKELERVERILTVLPLNFTSNEVVDKLANAFAGYDIAKRLAEIGEGQLTGWK
jgi:hypothetical protein